MDKPGWTPSVVPYGADQTIYLVVDDCGPLGSVCRESEIERTEIESIVWDRLAKSSRNFASTRVG